MMHTEPRGFDRLLLDDLKDHVASRARSAATAPARTRKPGRRLVPVLIAGAAAAAAGALTLPGVFAGPAYAVERNPDGSIRIAIKEYRDPDGLARKLRGFGVNAVIDYLPSGKQCKEPRATYVPATAGLDDILTAADEDAAWLLHPDKIGEGRTLVYTVWLYEQGENSASSGRWQLATGPVAPCEVVSGGPEVGPDGVTPGD